MKKSNNIISDWLKKYGDPEIDKKVEIKLEKMNNERYYQIIDEVYENYLNEWTFEKDPNGGSVYSIEPIKVKEHTKEQFVYRCKTDLEFSEKWRLKIEERELSDDERYNLLSDSEKKSFIVATIPGLKYGEEIKYSLNTFYPHIPTRQITLTHNGTKIEVYE